MQGPLSIEAETGVDLSGVNITCSVENVKWNEPRRNFGMVPERKPPDGLFLHSISHSLLSTSKSLVNSGLNSHGGGPPRANSDVLLNPGFPETNQRPWGNQQLVSGTTGDVTGSDFLIDSHVDWLGAKLGGQAPVLFFKGWRRGPKQGGARLCG